MVGAIGERQKTEDGRRKTEGHGQEGIMALSRLDREGCWRGTIGQIPPVGDVDDERWAETAAAAGRKAPSSFGGIGGWAL